MSDCDRCPYWVTKSVGGCHIVCREELEKLVRERVTLIISLVEDDELYTCWKNPYEFIKEAEAKGIKVIRLATPDFGSPDPSEACRVYRRVQAEEHGGGRIVFHCYAGYGRTGTLLAGYLKVAKGLPVDEAIALVKKANPCAGPQSLDQEYFLTLISCT